MDSFPTPVKQQFFQPKNETIDNNYFGDNYNNATGLPLGLNQKSKNVTSKSSPKTIINNFKENCGDKLALSERFPRNYLSKKRSGSNLGTALTTSTATSHNQPKRSKNCETNENFEKENHPDNATKQQINFDKLRKNQSIRHTTTTTTTTTTEGATTIVASATIRQRNNIIDTNILNSYGERILNGSDNMSTFHPDYHYDSTSNSTNGSSAIASNKYLTGAKNHCSVPVDSYYGTDLSTKQQLCDIALSMASLCNIGNSCYMNSVIYTLRFTPLFLHNLHHLVNDFSQIVNKRETQMKLKSASLGRNVSGLQGQNSRSYSSKDLASLGSSSPSTSTSPALEIIKTSQQIAMEKLHDLFKNLTSNEMTESIEPFQSDLLLKAIQDVNPIFEGNQQQDAHEFLMCILDSIRESCQTITKIINDHPEIIFSSLTENFDRLAVKTTVTIPPTTEKKSASWFKLRNKENKSKNTIVMDSPSKDSNSFDAVASNSDAINATGSAIESLLLNKQTIQEKIKALGLDFFSEDFEGVTASSIQCLACETTTEQKETMIDLSVPITENMETHELTDSFIQSRCITRERFHGDNKFRCENCMGLTEAIRKISYPKLPRILIIQLKRFSGGMEKINSYYPTPFTLQCFCAACMSDHNNFKGHEYKLYSVITHVGSTLQAGHYIAYTCALNQNNIHFDCFKNIQTVVAGTTNATTATTSSSSSSSSTTTTTTSSSSSSTTTTIITSATNLTSTQIHTGIPVDEANENSGESTHSMKIPNSTELNRQSSFSTSSSINTSAVRDVMKKIGLGRKKSSANNSIDSGKNAKIVNGLKVSINGVDVNKLANNSNASNASTTVTKIQCPSHSCCGIKMKTNLLINSNNGNDTTLTNGMDYMTGDQSRSKCGTFNSYGDHSSSYFTRSLDDDATKKLIDDDGKNKLDEDARKMALKRQRQINNGTTYSTGSSKLNSEPIWYMCDDDKIKAIPQHEFREMLLPKKNMITPYLLFYARNDIFEPH